MAIRTKATVDIRERLIKLGTLRPSLGGIALDQYAFQHQTVPVSALESFERATLAVMTHRPGVGVDLEAALVAAPNMVAALGLSGFCNVILARPETMTLARSACERAILAVERNDGATADEIAMLGALTMAVQGYLRHAADILDEHLATGPGPLLMIKLSHALRFMAGDQAGMRRTTHQILSTSQPSRAGYGFILGMHAFALEETGAYVEALRLGMEAVEREPGDSWGIHAIAHVFEMTGRSRAGLAWLRSTADRWEQCNNFAGHVAWHSALFHLEQRNCSAALRLYDTAVHREQSEDFRDFANAASLLFRLAHAGVDVGERWHQLADTARQRRRQHGLIFARLHDMIVLAAVGDYDACRDTLRAMEDMACGGDGDQAHVAAYAGVPLGRVILGSVGAAKMTDNSGVAGLASHLRILGGSNAQRDLLVQILAHEAMRQRDHAVLSEIMAVRRLMKRTDAFHASMTTTQAEARTHDGQFSNGDLIPTVSLQLQSWH